jgi:sortase A
VRKKAAPEDLTVEELRRLLVEKRRSARQERLERFRRTGRVVTLVSDAESASLEHLHSGIPPQAGEESAQDQPARRSRLRRFMDGFLLIVEISAVLGLVYVLYNGFDAIRNLNRQTAEVLALPTLTPTPLIEAVVLPGGHLPPDAMGAVLPNDAEIPDHLRPLVQSLAKIAIPTPGPEQANRIQIPAIHVDAPIVQGDGWEQLKKGVGQHIGSADPGEKGNAVFTAHDDVFGEIFRDLEKLTPGDQIILHTSQRSYTYIITAKKIVEPSQVDVMSITPQASVTLISCYPYLIDNKRIIVTALMQVGSR